jgi:hypothetical protein
MDYVVWQEAGPADIAGLGASPEAALADAKRWLGLSDWDVSQVSMPAGHAPRAPGTLYLGPATSRLVARARARLGGAGGAIPVRWTGSALDLDEVGGGLTPSLYPEASLRVGVGAALLNCSIAGGADIGAHALVGEHDLASQVGVQITVGARAVIRGGTRVGDHVRIGADARIGRRVRLDDFVSIGPRASIGQNTTIGASTEIGAGIAVPCNWSIPRGLRLIHPSPISADPVYLLLEVLDLGCTREAVHAAVAVYLWGRHRVAFVATGPDDASAVAFDVPSFCEAVLLRDLRGSPDGRQSPLLGDPARRASFMPGGAVRGRLDQIWQAVVEMRAAAP